MNKGLKIYRPSKEGLPKGTKKVEIHYLGDGLVDEICGIVEESNAPLARHHVIQVVLELGARVAMYDDRYSEMAVEMLNDAADAIAERSMMDRIKEQDFDA